MIQELKILYLTGTVCPNLAALSEPYNFVVQAVANLSE